MKKIFFSMTFLLFAVTAFSQREKNPKHSRDYFLKNSKTQKKLANVFVITGGACIVTALVIPKGEATVVPLNCNFPYPCTGGYNKYKNTNTKDILMLIGFVCLTPSIPLYLSSFINKRKAGRATTINFNNQRILLPQQGSFVFKTQPSLTLKIGL